MKTPKQLWDELEPLGKWFSWFIFPTYYLTKLVFLIIGLVFYGVYSAWSDND